MLVSHSWLHSIVVPVHVSSFAGNARNWHVLMLSYNTVMRN